MKGYRDLKPLVIEEYLQGGTSFHKLGKKYGLCPQTVWRWFKKHEAARGTGAEIQPNSQKSAVRLLSEPGIQDNDLQKSQLEVRLLKEMIAIAEKELGIDIRKKYGAKRS